MNSQPLVSVLLANYNNGKYLLETLDSIFKQSYINWEIIIVDDCSTDISVQLYGTLKEDGRIKVFINEENKGCGYSKRRCVEVASGEICTFLDPDDTITDNALDIMVKKHLENPNCSLVHSKLYYCDEQMNITREYPSAKNIAPGDIYYFNLEGEVTALSSFKKSFYDNTEGIDPYLLRAVDQDLYLKLYDVGETVFVDEALYYYRIHDGGISTNANARKAYYWRWYVIMTTIKRRNINFENKFFDFFIPKHEYDYIQDKYNRYKKLDKIIEKIKHLFRSK